MFLRDTTKLSIMLHRFLDIFLEHICAPVLVWGQSKHALPPYDPYALANMQSWAPQQCHDETQSGSWCEGQTQWSVLADQC